MELIFEHPALGVLLLIVVLILVIKENTRLDKECKALKRELQN